MSNNLLFDRKIEFAFGLVGEEYTVIKDLRVKFNIEKTAVGSPNKAQVVVYNMSKNNRSLAERGTRKNPLTMVLKAGYSSNIKQIFIGDVSWVVSEILGPDIVTTFEIGDGEAAYQLANINKSYSGGTSLKDIFKDVIGSFGKTVKDLKDINPENIIHGLTLSGKSKEAMDQLCDKQGLEWSIQSDAIQITKKDGATSQEAFVLTTETGLIGIPKKKKKDLGIDLNSLLQPEIEPCRIIEVKSKEINGLYRARRVVHQGDNFGGDFMTSIEAEDLNRNGII